MIHKKTKLLISDNTDGKTGRCIQAFSKGSIGSKIILSIKTYKPNTAMTKGKIEKGVIVRTTKQTQRLDGSSIKFYSNGVVIMGKRNTPKGKRTTGPMNRDIKKPKILSISSVIL
jgi:large subunit ribosomal protein L14